jgi:hypothetical protein
MVNTGANYQPYLSELNSCDWCRKGPTLLNVHTAFLQLWGSRLQATPDRTASASANSGKVTPERQQTIRHCPICYQSIMPAAELGEEEKKVASTLVQTRRTCGTAYSKYVWIIPAKAWIFFIIPRGEAFASFFLIAFLGYRYATRWLATVALKIWNI